jgi:hypothetical protein
VAEWNTAAPTAAPGEARPSGGAVELGEHQSRELVPRDALQRLVHRDQLLVDELGGDPERGGGGALADPRLQHPQLAAFDGELDVAQVPVVGLQPAHHRIQLARRLRVTFGQVGEGEGVADARDDVLALRVGQVVAVDALPSGGRVAGETHPGTRVRAEVAEHHRAHVHGGAEIVRDPLATAVEPRPLGVPGVEHCVHRQVELLARLLRERAAGLLVHHLLVGLDELFEVVRTEVDVLGDAPRPLHGVQRLDEQCIVDTEHGLAEHRDEPPVGVPGEPLVPGHTGQTADRHVVQPDVEDRLHHPRHRELRPGPHRHQQRILRVPELTADPVLQRPQRARHLHPERRRHHAVGQVAPARPGRHREPRWHGQPEPGHLGEVGPLAAEKILLVLAALAELVHVLRHQLHLTEAGVRSQASAL